MLSGKSNETQKAIIILEKQLKTFDLFIKTRKMSKKVEKDKEVIQLIAWIAWAVHPNDLRVCSFSEEINFLLW